MNSWYKVLGVRFFLRQKVPLRAENACGAGLGRAYRVPDRRTAVWMRPRWE